MAKRLLYDQATFTAAEGLRRWRRAAGMTQEDFAQCCGVSRKTVMRWEDPGCSHSPGVVHIIRLCEATGAIPDVLYRTLTRREAEL